MTNINRVPHIKKLGLWQPAGVQRAKGIKPINEEEETVDHQIFTFTLVVSCLDFRVSAVHLSR